MSSNEITIGDVCNRFSSGDGISASMIHETGEYPVFGGNGIRGYTDHYNFDGECFLIGRQGANCGNVRYFSGKGFMTEHAIVGTSEKANTGFLSCLLSTMNLSRYQGQSAQPGLSVKTLSSVVLSLPDRDSQNRIFSLIHALDSIVENNNAIISELESMAKDIYDYWFVQFDFPDENGKPYKSNGGKMVWDEVLKREIPEKWTVTTYSDCITSINTGLNPRDNFKLNTGGTIRYITVKNLTSSGMIDFTSCDTIDKSARAMVHKRSDIKVGDILFASISPLGRCYIITEPPETWDINESVFSIRPNMKNMTSSYLYMSFTDNSFVKRAEGSSVGSVFKGIRISELQGLKIILPPKTILTAFEEKVRSLFEMKTNAFNENQELTSLRDWLLPMLMNGQVKVGGAV